MKKALSVLLAMCLLLTVAMPLAFAAYTGDVVSTATEINVGGTAELSLNPGYADGGGDAGTSILWKLNDEKLASLSAAEGESVTLTGLSGGYALATAYEGATTAANKIGSVEVKINRIAYPSGAVQARDDKTEFPVDDFTELYLDPLYQGTDDNHWVYWQIDGAESAVDYIVVFRPGRSVDGAEEDKNPSDDHFTYNKESMYIYGLEPGKVTINVYERAIDEVTGDVTDTLIDSIDLKIKYADSSRGDPTENELWTILKIWWNDLKWTWNYEIHPWLKHSYFAVVAWFESIPATIAGWFANV